MNEYTIRDFEDVRIDEQAHEFVDSEPNVPRNVSPIPVIPQLSVALGVLVATFGVTYVGATHTLTKHNEEVDVRVERELTALGEQKAQTLAGVFDGVTVRAKSAIVWDVETQRILFNKNADDQLPLASVTKLMTALVAYELLNPNDTVSVSTDAIRTEGSSGFVDGETFTVQNLIDLTLISSSNDGAAALGIAAGKEVAREYSADAVFVEAMNQKADDLGLTKTHFANSTGLDLSATEAGAYGSARDVAHLLEYIIAHAYDAIMFTDVRETKVKNTNGEYHTAENTNTVVESIEGLIASKTGYTTLAGGNLAVAFNAGLKRPIIVVVLGSTEAGRFSDTLELVERARRYVEGESL